MIGSVNYDFCCGSMGLVFHHGYSRVGGKILIKWTVLLTHLWQATVLPDGSYDDDDILTESP